MEERLCLECGQPIFGRIDKKFCDDQCRNTYNNRQNADSNNYVRNVHNTLRKNRRILEELNPNDKGKTTKSIMLNKGFDFTFHTSTYTTKAGATYYFCYEYGYLPIENDYMVLVKRKEGN
jgi:hypothetical protein